jgi:hypothetical protein
VRLPRRAPDRAQLAPRLRGEALGARPRCVGERAIERRTRAVAVTRGGGGTAQHDLRPGRVVGERGGLGVLDRGRGVVGRRPRVASGQQELGARERRPHAPGEQRQAPHKPLGARHPALGVRVAAGRERGADDDPQQTRRALDAVELGAQQRYQLAQQPLGVVRMQHSLIEGGGGARDQARLGTQHQRQALARSLLGLAGAPEQIQDHRTAPRREADLHRHALQARAILGRLDLLECLDRTQVEEER